VGHGEAVYEVWEEFLMAQQKVLVPEGMLKAAVNAYRDEPVLRSEKDTLYVLESALFWLAKNPIVPTEAMKKDIENEWLTKKAYQPELFWDWVFGAVQRRLFVESEPDAMAAVKDLLWEPKSRHTQLDRDLSPYDVAHDADVLEAYRRGQKSK